MLKFVKGRTRCARSRATMNFSTSFTCGRIWVARMGLTLVRRQNDCQHEGTDEMADQENTAEHPSESDDCSVTLVSSTIGQIEDKASALLRDAGEEQLLYWLNL